MSRKNKIFLKKAAPFRQRPERGSAGSAQAEGADFKRLDGEGEAAVFNGELRFILFHQVAFRDARHREMHGDAGIAAAGFGFVDAQDETVAVLCGLQRIDDERREVERDECVRSRAHTLVRRSADGQNRLVQ